MNIFILDTDIKTCAQYHCDQHVSKMILESVQMLCASLNKAGMQTPYKSTHVSHPCVLWIEQSADNFQWLKNLAEALNAEYRFRYRKQSDHKSIEVLRSLPKCPFAADGITEFAQAMPAEYKVPGDAVSAYRNFYLAEKSRFATWTRRPQPAWFLLEADHALIK